MDLLGDARAFADSLTDLLNGTVCDGVRLNAVTGATGRAVVGYRISKDNQQALHGIPVALGKKPTCYLGLSYRLQPDDEGQHLTVQMSFVGLFADEGLGDELLHYDYERGKTHGYPEAHLQLNAQSSAWDNLCKQAGKPGRPLEKLHLPVGGRRFRPTLEDVVEFLSVEGFADMRPGWEDKVAAQRDAFRRLQLKASVRRDPDAAIEALRANGFIDDGDRLTDPRTAPGA